MTNEPFDPNPEEEPRPVAGEPIDPTAPFGDPDPLFDDDPDPVFGDTGDGAAAAPPPPLPPLPPLPPQPGPPARLVRDPYTRLGGVASGIAHHYGLDVSLVRIVFLLLVFASGFGILAYLLAWLIIPRADYWPPAPRHNALRSLGGRELGLALAGGGILLAIAIGAGGAGGFLIPLALVGGGVWLLVQPAAEPTAPAVAGGMGTPPAAGPTPPTPAAPAVHGAPVPPRRRRGLVAFLVAVGLLVVAIPALVIGGVVAAVAFGQVSFDGGERVTFRPTSAAALPYSIDRDAARLTIDLTGLESDDFDGTETQTIDARLVAGRITVIVPDDLVVSIDAATDIGDVDVYGVRDSGFGNRIIVADPDPDVELDLDVSFGAITVERG